MASGIPLEMTVYDFLISELKADWIEPEYGFSSLDENLIPIQRSIDFAASVPSEHDPVDPGHIQIYFLIECKYCDPQKLIWLFMPDSTSLSQIVFDEWRPFLWQDRKPHLPFSEENKLIKFPKKIKLAKLSHGQIPKCVRGTTLGFQEESDTINKTMKNNPKIPTISTGLHQLRDCLHYVAIERFRMFTKECDPAAAIILVPLLVTNAELRILKPGIYSRLIKSQSEERLPLIKISTVSKRLLLRCPSSIAQVDWKWQKFHSSHGNYDLSRIETGLPMYKRERTIEFHFRTFFSITPSFVTVINLTEVKKVIAEVIDWANRLQFE